MALAKNIKCPNRDANLCVGTNRTDTMTGTRHAETVRDRAGSDKVFGQGFANELYVGPGKDVLNGGGSGDFYHFAQGWGKDRIADTPIIDNDLDSGHLTNFRAVPDDLKIDMNSGTGPEVKNASGTKTVNWDDGLIDAVFDGQDDDTIIGRDVGDNIEPVIGGVDIVMAGDGDDLVNTQDGISGDTIDCGAGANDQVCKDAGDKAISCES